jgi:hypothetical protein
MRHTAALAKGQTTEAYHLKKKDFFPRKSEWIGQTNSFTSFVYKELTKLIKKGKDFCSAKR